MSSGQLNIFASEPDVQSRAGAYDEPSERVYQLTELPGVTFKEIFSCQIDESAGLREAHAGDV